MESGDSEILIHQPKHHMIRVKWNKTVIFDNRQVYTM